MPKPIGVWRRQLVVSKVLNYVERSVTATYDRQSYHAEKRYALKAWATRLEEIVSGKRRVSKVVAIAARKAQRGCGG